ncbi:MAG: hypothetical protein JRF61_04850 [Deltaproteobacteria bacterium]|nr:hypothetical protein [Deltaproteobacteria bacterium]
MPGTSWHDAYTSDLQSLYGLLVVPLAFLAYRLAAPMEARRAVDPASARFVSGLTLIFAVLTMVDPIATGPLVRSEALAGGSLARAIPIFFVILGDLRVLWLALGVARPERRPSANLVLAVGASLIVPVASGLVYLGLGLVVPALDEHAIWMIYELFFLALCVHAGRRLVARSLGDAPARASYLRALFGYSAAYYALWLTADLLIVVGGLDLGWAIRMVPNQLYYGFWVVFAYTRFFCVRPSKAA